MNNLYEVLEICLRDIEQGADVDTVLFHYPDFADELRPILEASVNAKSMAIPAPSLEVVQRNRARVLQQAARMREAKARRSSRRIWLASLRRVAVTLLVVAVLFVSGTNLVRAASTTLPGDHLYPVKRTWEDVLLLFTFNVQQRQVLEVEHENERVYEVRELFAEGRSADVEFAGLVTSQNATEWVISPGITVLVSGQTELPDGLIAVGSAVRVEGLTQNSGAVVAEKIELLPPGAKLPDLVGDEPENEILTPEGEDRQGQYDSEGESEGDIPKAGATESPGTESEQQYESSNDGSSSDKSGLDSNSGDSHEGDRSGGDQSKEDGSSHQSSDDSGGSNDGSGGGDD